MKLNKLTAMQAARAGPGRHGDGGGLALIVSKAADGSLNRKYVFRFTWLGKPTECGMGGYGTTLAEARTKAAEARAQVRAGINPIEGKRAAKRAERHKSEMPTFGKCATALIASKKWRSEVHRGQWRVTLETHAATLWDMPVDQVDAQAVQDVLGPIWNRIPETANRVRGRIETILNYAKAKRYRSGENPAVWRGNLADAGFSPRDSLSRGHHAAMPYAGVPGFLASLRSPAPLEDACLASPGAAPRSENIGDSRPASTQELALEFLILTSARLGEILGARWDEIDLESKVWVIPASRMKSGREHRVPLSARAVEILETIAGIRHNQFVFPGRHGQLSRSAVAALVPKGATIHGFRSSFRDWAGEITSFPRELAEAALAHTTGDATERAYRRGDALEKRRMLMDAWAQFCEAKAGDNVVHMRRQAATDG